jgi:predicted membrane channel-forming protein YqfA (hemolysin III family)
MSRRERNYHLIGWTLFLVCAVFFIVSAALSGDLLYLAGSIIFFVACIAFIIPLMSKKRHAVPRDEARSVAGSGPESSA